MKTLIAAFAATLALSGAAMAASVNSSSDGDYIDHFHDIETGPVYQMTDDQIDYFDIDQNTDKHGDEIDVYVGYISIDFQTDHHGGFEEGDWFDEDSLYDSVEKKDQKDVLCTFPRRTGIAFISRGVVNSKGVRVPTPL